MQLLQKLSLPDIDVMCNLPQEFVLTAYEQMLMPLKEMDLGDKIAKLRSIKDKIDKPFSLIIREEQLDFNYEK